MQIAVGDKASFTKTIAECDVYGFAGIVGDFNPVHIDATAAENSMFKKRVAHGMLVGGLISTVLGTKLPGPGTIYLEQSLKFLHPTYIQDTITATVVVKEIVNPEKGIYKLETKAYNQNGQCVVDGFAIVMYRS